jgi:sugar (pentulose or hexulose) kinase
VTSPVFLGLDLGTTRAKAGLFDATGRQHAYAAVGWSAPARPATGASEADAELWWYQTRHAIAECLRQVGSAHVAGVCAGGQGPSLVALDDDGRPVRPALLYDDTRATPEADALSECLGRPVSARNAYLPRALWLRDHEPASYARTRWFLQAWDFLTYRLTGVPVASSPGGVYTPWRADELATARLDAAKFPALVQTGRVVAPLSAQAAAETGLPIGTPVAAGGGDFLLATLGSGTARTGLAQSQGGSTGAFTLCWDRPLAGPEIAWSIPSPVQPALFNVGGPLTTAGAALDWLLEKVLGGRLEREAALAAAARVPPGATGLLFFPYLAGEQLLGRPEARGVLVGLSLAHSGPHLVRAVLEGVALAGRTTLEALLVAGGRVDAVVTYGGQARSELWNRIKASVWRRTVITPRTLDAGCVGAAAIAAVAAGAHASLAAASDAMAGVGQRFAPDPAWVARYDAVYAIYRRIYARNRTLLADLAALQEGGVGR